MIKQKINITFEVAYILFKTRNSMTSIPPLPGTNFGGIKNDSEVKMISAKDGK